MQCISSAHQSWMWEWIPNWGYFVIMCANKHDKWWQVLILHADFASIFLCLKPSINIGNSVCNPYHTSCITCSCFILICYQMMKLKTSEPWTAGMASILWDDRVRHNGFFIYSLLPAHVYINKFPFTSACERLHMWGTFVTQVLATHAWGTLIIGWLMC